MTKTSFKSDRLLSPKRIAVLASALVIVLAAVGSLLISQSATTLSSAVRWTMNASGLTSSIPVQSTNTTLFLHGTGPLDNPPTLFLDTTASTASSAKFKDSSGVSRSGGNQWKEVGTWNATSATSAGSLTSLSDLHVWLGLKNSDDQGTYFDLRAEAYKNDELVASGQSLCITGIVRNAANAKEVVLSFDPFSATSFNGASDVLKLRISTRVGTNADSSSCGGHNSAAGLRLYFDALTRSSRFVATHGFSDTTAPELSIEQPSANSVTTAAQVNVTGTFNDQNPTTITVNGVTATITGTSFSATVPLTEGVNQLSVVGVDTSGNQGTASRSIIRDTTQPVIFVLHPAEGVVTGTAEIDVTGTINDLTATTVTVNNVPAPLSGGVHFSALVPLIEGSNVLTVRATDAAGNQSESVVTTILDTVAPILTLTEPAADHVSGTTAVNIRGTVADRDVGLVAVTANDQRLTVSPDGSFTGSVVLPEGSQSINIVATDAGGNQGTLVRAVVVDLSPPEITSLTPVDGTVIDTTTTISGQITDTTAVVVKVNNVPATVTPTGSFTSAALTIAEGQNQITITATDAGGNENTATLLLVGRDRTAPAPPTLAPVISPTRLAFQTIEGLAESGAHISVTGGTQPQTADAAFGTGIFVLTINLATGANPITVTATDAAGNTSQPVQFTITSDPQLALPPAGTASQINISTGNGQKGLVGTELPRPLIAIVTDRNGAPVSGSVVQFTVEHGGGSFVGGGTVVTSTTDNLGHASVRYVVGAGVGIQQVRASFNGNTLTPAIFLAESLQPVGGAATTVSGVVLDQNLRALPNVLVRLGGQQTRSGVDGTFLLTNVAAGPHQLLELIGRDQITLPGRWPNITYDFDVLPGVHNDLGRPLFLPKVNNGINVPLDANNIVTQDTVYELPVVGGEPPIRVTAKAGTRITFPPDVTDKRLSVTRIPTNRVPMVLEDGRATNLYISVQPSGAIFDQPLEISFPNLDRLPANSQALLMSFDHDAGRYIKVGTGHVSADGRSITSDAGSGIRVGAWHGLPPDPPQPEVTVLGHVKVAGNPALEGKEILAKEAWVEGQRAVEMSSPTNSEGIITEVNYRAILTLPRDAPPRLAKLEAHYQAQNQTITLAPTRIFLAPEKTKDVTATLSLPVTGTPKFTWKTKNRDIATVAFATNNTDASVPNVVTITSGKREKAGSTKIEVEYKSSTGVKAKAEIEVTLVRVDFEQTGDCSGFDDTKVNIPGTQNNEPFWLTVVLNGTALAPQAGGTAQANARITPSSAAAQVRFEVVDTGKATIGPATATTSPQLITLTGVTHGETQVRALVDNEEAGILGIAVRRRVQIRASFHFISDTGGHRQHVVNTGDMPGATAAATATVNAINQILTRQTGIEYVRGDVFFNQVQQDLTDVVSETIDVPIISAFRDANANQDIYFVWELEKTETIPVAQPGQVVNRVVAAFVGAGGNNIFAEDGATAQDLVHEALHAARVLPKNPYPNDPAHSNVRREILYPTRNGTGCLIPKRDLDLFHTF